MEATYCGCPFDNGSLQWDNMITFFISFLLIHSIRYFTSWIETYSHEQQLSSSHAEGDSEEEYSDSSSYSDEDTDKDDLADDSVVEFRSDLSTVKDSSSGDEVFEFSSDYDSGMLLDIPGATARLQLESKLLDMSPSRFRKLVIAIIIVTCTCMLYLG